MSLAAILPPTSGGTPPFANVREAQEWLTLLPLINIRQSRLELAEAFAQLNESRIDAVELLKILELLREAVQITELGLQPYYAGKPLPLLPDEAAHWQAAQKLWEQIETAYARCWRALVDGEAALAGHHALIAERAMSHGSRVARGYLLVYRPVPQRVWQRLFERYQLAEASGIAAEVVRDSLIDIHGKSMPQAMLIHALLLAASNTRHLSGKQLLWLDRRLEVFATRTSLARHAPTPPGKTSLQIDLTAPGPALRMGQPLQGDSIREIDTLALAQTLMRRIKPLREGEQPQNIGLGTELAPRAAEMMLTDQYRHWCELPTGRLQLPRAKARACPVALELANLQRLIADGKLAPPPADPTQLDRRDLERLQLFGHVSASTRPQAEPVSGVSEPWDLLHESALDLLLARPAGSATRIGLQQLAGIALNSHYLVGTTRTLEDTGDQLEIGLRLLPGIPVAAMARATDLARLGQAKYSEILLLPEIPALKAPPSLILPVGWFRPSRLLDIWDGETLRRVRLAQLVERGADYERVLYAPAGS